MSRQKHPVALRALGLLDDDRETADRVNRLLRVKCLDVDGLQERGFCFERGIMKR